MSLLYTFEALNLYDSVSIKGIRSLLGGKIIDSSPQELQLQYGENSFLFVFRFGCLVFFNISSELRELELKKLRVALGEGIAHPTSESYQLIQGEQLLKVEFEFVEMKEFNLEHIRMIATTVGQSAALEYFESKSDQMLNETANQLTRLSKFGSTPLLQSHRLVRMIGSIASTRQYILSHLSILDPPDATWKSKELEKLYSEVQENFDIGMRFRILDRKLSLIQENIEILADLTTSRRSNLLEILIATLIVIELVFIVFK